MSMINDVAVRGELVAERRDFRREAEVEKLTGWKLLFAWIGMLVLSWAVVIGMGYGLWQLFLHYA